MPLPVLLAVDDDRDALDDVETQLAQRYAHDYRIESLGDPDEALRMLQELADVGRGRGARARRVVALVGIGPSPARARAPAAPARRARAARPGGRLVGSADRRRDPRRDGARTHRLLRAAAGRARSTRSSTRQSRAFCSSGRGIARRAADGAHRRRDVVRPGLRAAGRPSSNARRRTSSAWRSRSRVASCSRKAGPDAKLAADGASRRRLSERPVQRRDRRGSSLVAP